MLNNIFLININPAMTKKCGLLSVILSRIWSEANEGPISVDDVEVTVLEGWIFGWPAAIFVPKVSSTSDRKRWPGPISRVRQGKG